MNERITRDSVVDLSLIDDIDVNADLADSNDRDTGFSEPLPDYRLKSVLDRYLRWVGIKGYTDHILAIVEAARRTEEG